MRRRPPIRKALTSLAFMVGVSALTAGPARPAAIEVFPAGFTLDGPDDGRQLLVNVIENGRPHDATRSAAYAVAPAGVVTVAPGGYVRPAGKGAATITVRAAGVEAAVRVTVHDADDQRPVHFANDLVPLLTRYGCNAGGCHGKASGQNGFKLSLLGFDPKADYDALVKEGRGRRVFPAAPERSLLLTKPAGLAPHGGGKRFAADGAEYRLLRRWIVQGTPVGDPKAPAVDRIEIVPAQRVLGRQARQQLAVLAHYTDGAVRDVSRQAQYRGNEPAVAVVDDEGLVRTLDLAGEAAVMARYAGLVAVSRVTVPLGKPGARYDGFHPANFIDGLALTKWKQLGLQPSPLCTDGEFIRRVCLDLCGRLATPEEVRAFLADARPDKRSRLIDRCLDDPDYANFAALRWGSILRNTTKQGGESELAAYSFHRWMRETFRRNVPYDEFVRAILTATGSWESAPAVNWLWQMADDPLHQPTADAAQVFLGVRMQCARCHHHPFERWGQDDYYGLAGFFARVGRKSVGDDMAFFNSPQPTTDQVNPRTGQVPVPKAPGGPVLTVPPDQDPRVRLADWMARPDNPFFAKAVCNRAWGHLLGRGLVDPVDDLRETNPPSNPELLDALAKDFVAHRFDLKHLFRTVCNSRVYQLSSEANDWNRHDRQNHARYYPKRLMAEVLLDAVDQVCGTRTDFNKVPPGTRAVALPHDQFDAYFLDVFDRPTRSSACECARGSGASLMQVLHLSNSPEVEDKMAADTGRVARLARPEVSPAQAVEELYLAALARRPTPAEAAKALAYVTKRPDRRRALEDVLWTLLNGSEFLFNR